VATAMFDRVRSARAKSDFEMLEPDAERREVRWWRFVVGALVIAAAGLAGWLMVQSQSAETQVWVARERIDAGSVIDPNDLVLRAVETGSSLSAIEGDQDLVGRSVRMAIPAGSALVAGHLFDGGDVVATGDAAEMSLIFSAGRITESVERNDLVRIAVVLDDSGELAIFDQVPIVSVDDQERGATMVNIDISVEDSDRLVSALASADSVWATVVGRR